MKFEIVETTHQTFEVEGLTMGDALEARKRGEGNPKGAPVVSRIAREQARYRIPRDCLDSKGNLKPESPCAKKMRESRTPKNDGPV